MSARIFVLCLLLSVISTAASLKCQSCFSCRNKDIQLVKCEADKIYCLTFSFRNTMNKSCATAEQCSNAYYEATSVAGKYKQARVDCCKTDGCNIVPLHNLSAPALMNNRVFLKKVEPFNVSGRRTNV